MAKDTDTVKICMLHYGGSKPLKIEVSYRNKYIDSSEVDYTKCNPVYTIDRMLELKVAAYRGRSKIRDLYDVTYIANNFKGQLPNYCIRTLRDAVLYNGIEYADYLMCNQDDPLIDKVKLGNDFLDMCDWLGVL